MTPRPNTGQPKEDFDPYELEAPDRNTVLATAIFEHLSDEFENRVREIAAGRPRSRVIGVDAEPPPAYLRERHEKEKCKCCVIS